MRAWLVGFFILTMSACLRFGQQMPSEKAPSGSLNIAPPKLEFGSLAVGTSSAPMTTSLSNAGKGPVKFTDITPSGIDFSETHTCGESLMPGGSCEIQVMFKPATTGERLGVLSVMVAGVGKPYLVVLTGTGQ